MVCILKSPNQFNHLVFCLSLWMAMFKAKFTRHFLSPLLHNCSRHFFVCLPLREWPALTTLPVSSSTSLSIFELWLIVDTFQSRNQYAGPLLPFKAPRSDYTEMTTHTHVCCLVFLVRVLKMSLRNCLVTSFEIVNFWQAELCCLSLGSQV